MISAFLKAALSAICAVVVATSAYAQAGHDDREQASKRVAEQSMAAFAKCVVGNKKRQAKALEYLQIPDGDPTQGAAGAAIASRECAAPGSQMRFQPDLFARSIYTALYRKYYWNMPLAEMVTIDASTYQSEYNVATTSVGSTQLALRAFGDCTVKQNPVAAHDFAISEMRGQSEKASVAMVVASMQECLNSGSTIKFSRTMLKGIIAESLYKLRARQATTASASDATGASK